jgi:hypothetical protein
VAKGLDALRAQRSGADVRVMFMVSPSIEAATADALARGWKQIARGRFVIEGGSARTAQLVVAICRFNELPRADSMPMYFGPEGKLPMIKAAGYEDGVGCFVLENWIKDMDKFDEFVKSGQGVWVD